MGASRHLRLGIFAIAALGGSVGLIRAQNDVSVQFHAFQDSRGVTVLTPDVDLNRDLTDRSSLRLKFGVDAITSASDSCIRCHPGGEHDQRITASAAFTQKVGATRLSVGGEIGDEHWYGSRALIASASHDFNGANTTIAGGLFNPTAQAWVTTTMNAEGRYSAGFPAIQLDNANATFQSATPAGVFVLTP